MNAAQKILIIIGAFFAAIGGTIALIMGSMARLTGMPFMAFVAIPLLFVALGAGFIIAVRSVIHVSGRSEPMESDTRLRSTVMWRIPLIR